MAGQSGVSVWHDSTNFSSGPGSGSGLEVLLQGFPDDLYLQLHGSFGAGDHPADLGVGMTLELPHEDLLELFGKPGERRSAASRVIKPPLFCDMIVSLSGGSGNSRCCLQLPSTPGQTMHPSPGHVHRYCLLCEYKDSRRSPEKNSAILGGLAVLTPSFALRTDQR